MSNLYNHLKEADGMNQYKAQASLSIYFQNKNFEVNHDDEITIPYTLDVDYKDWGISNISIIASSELKVPYVLTNDQGQEQSQEAVVDLSTAETEWVPAGFYGISELILSITENGGIASPKVIACFIDPTRG